MVLAEREPDTDESIRPMETSIDHNDLLLQAARRFVKNTGGLVVYVGKTINFVAPGEIAPAPQIKGTIPLESKEGQNGRHY